MSSFKEQLRNAAVIDDIGNTRIVKILSNGKTHNFVLRSFATHVYHSANAFTGQLVRIIKLADNQLAKLYLIENLFEEEGIELNLTKGLVQNIALKHTTWAMKMADAFGVQENLAEMPADTYKDPCFEEYMDSKDWLSACAYQLVGKEFNIPNTFAPIYEGLLNQGYSKAELTFLHVHIEVDKEHGEHGINLLNEVTPESRKSDILNAVKKGSQCWRDIFNKAINSRN